MSGSPRSLMTTTYSSQAITNTITSSEIHSPRVDPNSIYANLQRLLETNAVGHLLNRWDETYDMEEIVQRCAQHLLEANFYRTKAEIVGFLESRRQIFMLSSVLALENADLILLKNEYSRYKTSDKGKKIREYDDLKRISNNLTNPSIQKDLSIVEELWIELEAAEQDYLHAIERQEKKRQVMSDRRKRFHDSADVMLQWIQDRKNEFHNVNPEDIHQFCSKIAEKEPEFTDITRMSYGFDGDDEITRKVQDLHENTLTLQLTAHEKLRQNMIDCHTQCHLEDETLQLSGFLKYLQTFIQDVEGLLKEQKDEEFREEASPVLEQCLHIKRELAPFSGLVEHLQLFGPKVHMLRLNFDLLKNVILEKIGAEMAGQIRGRYLAATYDRRREFNRLLDEVKNWVNDNNVASEDNKTRRHAALGDVQVQLSHLRNDLQIECLRLRNKRSLGASPLAG